MQVVLLKDIKGVGREGSMITVTDGYAINFLLPQKLAAEMKSSLGKTIAHHVEEQEDRLHRNDAEILQELQKLPETITIPCAANAQGVLFRAVTPKIVAETLNTAGHTLPEEVFTFDPIKKVGTYTIPMQYKEYTGNVTIQINEKQ